MKPSTRKTILLLSAMVLTMVSTPFDGTCCEASDADHESAVLSISEGRDDSSPGHDAGHENRHCCESGCLDCSLPCCAGPVMIPSTVQPVDPVLQLDGSLTAATAEVSWVDPDRLFHPPRA